MTQRGPFDPGLQVERTLLAWRRTCLAFGGANLVAMRFTIEVAGQLAVVAGILGVGLALAAYVAAAAGYRHASAALHDHGYLRNGTGAAIATATAATLTLGIVCGAYLVMDAACA